jgi:hypothetical protein
MRAKRRFSSPRAYGKENPTGIEWLLIGLGTLTAIGISVLVYDAYQITQAYKATLPPGTTATTAGEQAWLQSPAGQAAVLQQMMPWLTPAQVQSAAMNMPAVGG